MANSVYNTLKNLFNTTIPVLKSGGSNTATSSVSQEIPALKSNGNTAVYQKVNRPYTDDEIIKEYESIPNYNLLDRFNTSNMAKYDYKNDLYPQYREAKDRQVGDFVKNNFNQKELAQYMADYNYDGTKWNRFKAPADFQETYDRITNEANKYGISRQDIMDYVSAKGAENFNKNLSEFADEHGVLGTGLSLGTNVVGNAVSGLGEVSNYLTGKGIGSNETLNRIGETTGDIRKTVGENIDSNLGKFAYNVATSIGDMGTAMLLGGAGGALPIMATNAGVSNLNENKGKTTSDDQKMLTAIAAGGIEALTEKIPTENLFKIIGSKTGKQTAESFVKTVLKQSGEEATEEFVSELANNIVDNVVNGKQSDYRLAIADYMSDGMTREQATKKANSDIINNALYSALAGAASGGVMGAGAVGLNSMLGGNNVDSNVGVDVETENTESNEIPVLNSNENSNANSNYNPEIEAARLLRLQQENDSVNADNANMEMLKNALAVNDTTQNLPQISNNATNTQNTSLNAENALNEQNTKPQSNTTIKADLQNYNSKEIEGFPEYNKELSKIIGMYGTDEVKAMYADMNALINQYIKTGDRAYMGEAVEIAAEIDRQLIGREYTYKRKKKNSVKSQNNVQKAKYQEDYFVYTVLDAYNEIKKIAEPNKYNGNQNVTVENTKNENVIPAVNNNNVSIDSNIPATNVNNDVAQNNSIPALMSNQTLTVNLDNTNNTRSNTNNTESNTTSQANNSVSNNIPALNTVNNNTDSNLKVRGLNETIVKKTDLPDEIKEQFIDKPDLYRQLSNKETLQKAENIYNSKSLDEAIVELKDMIAKTDAASAPLAYMISNELTRTGRTSEAVQILRELSEKMTKQGQFTQAAAIMMLQNNPQATLQYLVNSIDKLNEEGSKKYGKKWNDFELTDEEIRQFEQLKTGDKAGIENALDSVWRRVSKEYPTTLVEKLMEGRRIAMLLNARTQVRNISGNALVMPLRWTADRVAALGENVYAIAHPEYQKTQSLNPFRREQARNIAKEVFENKRTSILGDNKYLDSKDAEFNKQVYKGTAIDRAIDNFTGNLLTRLNQAMGKDISPSVLETLRNSTYWMLEQGDNVFIKENFVSRLGSYIEANNITDINDVPDDAIALAYEEAMKATFHDDTNFANVLSTMRKGLNNVAPNFGDILLPFVKTPANIAVRTIDYSPFGVTKGLKSLSEAKSDTDVARAITKISQGATGTALIALGFILAEAGIISGPLSDDKDEAQFQKNQGMLPYAINLSGKYFTYDWAQPASAPLIFGAVISNALKDKDNAVNAALQGLTSVGDAWLDLSPLQNVSDIFGGYGSPTENLAKSMLDSPLSWIPSQLAAAAKIADTTQRETTSKGNVLETLANQAKAKIPGLSQTLPEKRDTWGRAIQRQETTGDAAFANLINPGQTGYNRATDIDDDIQSIYESTGDKAVYPRVAEWKYTVNNEKHELSAQEHSDFQKIMGEASYNLAESTINSSYYENLTDDQRRDILVKEYNFATALAKAEMFGYDIAGENSTKREYSIYSEKGADGLATYYAIQSLKGRDEEGKVNDKMEDKIYAIEHAGITDKSEKGYYLYSVMSSPGNLANVLNELGSEYLYDYYCIESVTSGKKSEIKDVIKQCNLPDNEKEILYNVVSLSDKDLKYIAENMK